MVERKVLDFYKKTSLFTDLGLYKEFAINLPNNIKELCKLQRNQIIHPFDMSDEAIRKDPHSFYGNMTKIDITSLCYENDYYPTAIAMLSELLRRDSNFTINRKIEDKIHVCCREQAILLASILKAKGFSSRVRSGFAKYICIGNEEAGDHWITEYYDEKKQKWILVDADMYYDKETLIEYGVDFNLLDIPHDKFIFGAEAYLGLRNKKLKDNEIYYASSPKTYGIKASLHGLFYDFHSLMNNEIIFLQLPKYILDKNLNLTEEELKELDELATLMLDPDKNFDKLIDIWNTNEKLRILSGGMNS